jgi:hypothetical protein
VEITGLFINIKSLNKQDMKSKELEIALTTYIALKHNQDGCIGFIDGYTQCQEDMLKILKEEIKRAFIHGQGNAQMMEAGLERDEIEDYIYYRMLTLNKQD